jgi:hypothetical protein
MTEAKANMARYHKNKGMTYCQCDSVEEEKDCKFYDESPRGLHCSYRNLHIVSKKYKHCRHPDAQYETYNTYSLQV